MFKDFIRFFRLIARQRSLILAMAKREIATKYVGSMLGFIWTLINPLVFIGVLWFVFSVGFKSRPVEDVPFVVWLTAGFAAWNLFSDIVSGAPGAVVGYRTLIKKTIFPSQILPFVTIVASLFTHIIYIVILFVMLLVYRINVSCYVVQVCYYMFCLFVLTLGLSWALSSLNVFIRDVAQVVSVILQVGFWATPIFWDIKIMPERYHLFLKINPLYYIVQGYRDSFIGNVAFWEHPWLTLYFWSIAICIFIGGALVFRKLKPQFVDVL